MAISPSQIEGSQDCHGDFDQRPELVYPVEYRALKNKRRQTVLAALFFWGGSFCERNRVTLVGARPVFLCTLYIFLT